MPSGPSVDYSSTLSLSLLLFIISVVAAVIAVDMFRLLRTGETGKSWRVLSIASVIYALVQALRMSEIFDPELYNHIRLSQVAELVFVLALAYSFFLQRRVFSAMSTLRGRLQSQGNDESEDETDRTASSNDAIDADWSGFERRHQARDGSSTAGRENRAVVETAMPASERERS